MSYITDTAISAKYRVRVRAAESQERMCFLWELAERLKMEPVDAEYGEVFLRKAPSAKQLCAFIELSEPEGYEVVSCVRLF